MGNLFAYSVMSSLILAALYIPFRLFLSRLKQPGLNRSILLTIYALSLLTPVFLLMKPAWTGSEEVSIAAGGLEFQGVMINAGDSQSVDFAAIATGIYGAGLIVMLLMTAVSLISLAGIMRNTRKTEVCGIMVRQSNDTHTGPLSMLGMIVIPAGINSPEIGPILAHERSHVGRRHHLDLVLAHCIQILQWYNPAAWLMCMELKDVHEYQADTDTLSQGYDPRAYQRLLLSWAVGANNLTFTHNLNNNNLKKRIVMMNSKSAAGLRRLRPLLLVPMFAGAVAFMSVPSVAGMLESLSAVTASQITAESKAAIAVTPAPTTEAGKAVYVEVEKMPQYPGGEMALLKRLTEVIHYPEDALKNNITGRVVVKFVVDSTGKVTAPEIVRSVSPALDAEALAAVMKLDRFTPGEIKGHPVNVYYTLPVVFKTQDKGVKEVADMSEWKPSNAEIEQMPQYPGGEKFMMDHLSNLVKYPEKAMKEGRQGRVVVTFIVDEQGMVVDPTISKSVSPDLDQAALDAVNRLGYFEPGIVDGKPARVQMSLPVDFRLSSGDTEKLNRNKIYTLEELNNTSETPAYFINGKEATQTEAMNLSSAEISSISIIKNNKDYPNGMVMIMTK